MALFYSGSVGGFLDDAIYGALPEDARPVSAETHAALMAAASSGQIIVADESGDPKSVDPPAPSSDELLSRIRGTRDRLLVGSDFTQLDDAPLADTEKADWRIYRQALRDLPDTFAGDPGAIVWPSAPGSAQ